MSAMRGRRPRAPQRRYDSGVPRLAMIKLDSDWRAPPKVTRRGATVFAAATVLVLGAAVAGAAWLGGSLFDAREAFAMNSDRALTSLGFGAHVRVEGAPEARAREVLAAAMPEGRSSLLSADPYEIKARVESLDWVARASVQRRWPNDVVIQVARRAAFARWQENGVTTIIDASGERLLAERAVDHPELPLVVGRGAAHAAEPVLTALENLPNMRARTLALVRVSERRWNVETRSGATIELPEADPVAALAKLETLQTRYRLLDRPARAYDMRSAGRLSVRLDGPGLLGGPDLRRAQGV